MGKIKRSILTALILFTANLCFAKQITVQIVQHDVSADKVMETSMVVEDELLNAFFDNGFIVTNSPAAISVSTKEDTALFNSGIGDAYEGYSDYFVQVKLYFELDESERKNDLKKVDWTLASAVTGAKIKESTMDKLVYSTDSKDLKVLTFNLVKEIKKAIKA